MKALKEKWSDLAFHYSSDGQLISKLWNEIKAAYDSRGRHFHNLHHIGYMLRKAEEYDSLLDDRDCVLFAIFYHDIVYNVLRTDNEEQSANLAESRLSELGVPVHRITRSCNHILATKVHIKTDDSDTALVLDFDLAILGENPDTYFDYTRKVRQEYAVYPNEIFNEGRKKVLRQFLSMPEIYKSRYFVDRFERQARQNLTEELQTIG